jgi:uncharacterized membrane protein
MKPTQKSLKPHINNWVGDGLITQDQANSILAKYPVSSISPAVMTFSIVGGLLCVLGLILIISANWQSIPREVKLGGLLGLLAASTLLGAEGVRRKSYPAITEISYLFAAVLPLAGLVMMSQFFNISGSGFMLVLTWFLSILFLPFLSLSSSAFVVWLLALSALISLAITEHHWMLLDSEDHTLLAVAGIWGVVVAAGSQLWSKIGGTMQRSWGEALGLIMTSQALYAYDLSVRGDDTHDAQGGAKQHSGETNIQLRNIHGCNQHDRLHSCFPNFDQRGCQRRLNSDATGRSPHRPQRGLGGAGVGIQIETGTFHA